MFKKILIPLDGSKLAEKALPYAEVLAQKFEAQLILLRVLPPTATRTDYGQTGTYSPQLIQEWEAEAEAYLKTVQAQLLPRHLNIHHEVLEGNPVAEMILELACDQAIDLIVMSTHGYSGSDRWVYGSVANKILERAPCPVFLVRVKGADC